MRIIFDIALNYLRVQLSERGTLITVFVVPLLMMFFLGSISTRMMQSDWIIDVVRPADATDDQAAQFVALLKAEGKKQVQDKDRYIICDLAKPAEQPAGCKLSDLKTDDESTFSKRRLENGDITAVITVPANYGADLRAGKAVSLVVNVKGGPTVEQPIRQTIDAIQARLNGMLVAARIVNQQVPHDNTTKFYDDVYSAVQNTWAKEPVQVEELSSTVTGAAVGTGFGQSAPGIGAMFVLTSSMAIAAIFIQERKQWTLQRLMVMPLTRAQILAGKLLGQYLISLLSFAAMIGAGTALGVQWGDWPGVITIVLVYTLAVTAIGLAFSTLVRSAGQAQGIALLATMVLAPLGGAWWTLAIVPEWMQQIGKISPIYWSQDAFTKMIFYGAHLVDVLPSVIVLLVIAAAFFAFGVSRFQSE